MVVICFHSLIYWYLLQHCEAFQTLLFRCDLLSFFDLLIFVTTSQQRSLACHRLWFAFILWSTDICYNIQHDIFQRVFVVICFHSLIYWYLLQHWFILLCQVFRCDLLSFFDLLIFVTTYTVGGIGGSLLWFAFILWSTDICYNLVGCFCRADKGCSAYSGSKKISRCLKKATNCGRFFCFRWGGFSLKQLQLLRCIRFFGLFSAIEEFNFPELFIGYSKNTNWTMFG